MQGTTAWEMEAQENIEDTEDSEDTNSEGSQRNSESESENERGESESSQSHRGPQRSLWQNVLYDTLFNTFTLLQKAFESQTCALQLLLITQLSCSHMMAHVAC